MRVTEKAVAVIILALAAWAILMWTVTSFQGHEVDRVMRVELGSDAANLDQAVAGTEKGGVDHNIQMVVRNTHLDYVFIFLYWLTFVSLAMLAGRMGRPFLAASAGILISGAAVSDLLENGAILTAMQVRPFTDSVAVDISLFSEWKWAFFFLATLVLGLAIALNHRVSSFRRLTGGLFVASGAFGVLGIARYRVSLGFSFFMLNVGMLVLTVALILTLWKLYVSLKQLDHIEHSERVHSHA